MARFVVLSCALGLVLGTVWFAPAAIEASFQPSSVEEETREVLEDLSAVGAGAPAPGLTFEIGGKIVNGVMTGGFPSTGALLRGEDGATARFKCTLTLIGCRTALTAQHCTREPRTHARPNAPIPPEELFAFFQNAGIFAVESVVRHPDYAFPKNDVAVLRLASVVPGIPRARLHTAPVSPDTPAAIVGFGRTEGSRSDGGVKRRGLVKTAACPKGLPAGLFCWKFPGQGAPGQDSNTCNGDSGGPAFVAVANELRLAGVTSGGDEGCAEGGESFDADVGAFRKWIEGAAGVDLGEGTCGDLADVTGARARVYHQSGELSPAQTRFDFDLPVDPDAVRLVVTLNGDSGSGANDFDLEVAEERAPGAAAGPCEATASGQFASCVLHPQGGSHVPAAVTRRTGSGIFQLTATQYLRLP